MKWPQYEGLHTATTIWIYIYILLVKTLLRGRRNQLYKPNRIKSHRCKGLRCYQSHLTDLSSQGIQFIEPEPESSPFRSTKTCDRPINGLSRSWAVPWSVAYIAVGRYGGNSRSRNQKQWKTIGAVLVTERKYWARSSNATSTAIDKLVVCLHGGRN